jgi:hypothetical protein
MSLRRFSLAIKPAGSSLPVLIRRPVLNRVSACSNASLDRLKLFWAISELTFELIRVIENPPYGNGTASTWDRQIKSLDPAGHWFHFGVEGTDLSIMVYAVSTLAGPLATVRSLRSQ